MWTGTCWTFCTLTCNWEFIIRHPGSYPIHLIPVMWNEWGNYFWTYGSYSLLHQFTNKSISQYICLFFAYFDNHLAYQLQIENVDAEGGWASLFGWAAVSCSVTRDIWRATAQCTTLCAGHWLPNCRVGMKPLQVPSYGEWSGKHGSETKANYLIIF